MTIRLLTSNTMSYDLLDCLPSLQNLKLFLDCCKSVIDSAMLQSAVNIAHMNVR